MRPSVAVVLLSMAAGADAFLATPRWQLLTSIDLPVIQRSKATPAAAEGLASARPAQEAPVGPGTLLAGALAIGALLLRSRRTAVTRRGWDRKPAYPNMQTDGDPTRGPSYRVYVNLKKHAKKTVGRQRFFKQQQILRESGITAALGGYRKEHSYDGDFSFYKGPESHPNNPWFPHHSPGYKQSEAIRAWAPAQLAATSTSGTNASTFAGGSSKRFWRSSRGAGSALVLHAHKKTSASTKNQGHHLLPHHWGLTKHAYQGCVVKAGTRLCKQKGMNWYNGANVARGKDYSLVALRDGIVQWRGEYRHREISVVPWEYVREKCVWTNPNTLGPKKYEPWMGKRWNGKRNHINQLRREWLQTEEGKEWASKKKEKEERQKVISKKIRAYRKAKKVAARSSDPSPVAAGGGSDAEAEA